MNDVWFPPDATTRAVRSTYAAPGTMAPPRMDVRTAVFFLLTTSCIASAFACFVGSFGIPGLRRVTSPAYRASLASAGIAFAYRLVYSSKLEKRDFASARKLVATQTSTNGFHYLLYIACFWMAPRPVPTVLAPLALCAGLQLITIAHKHFAHTRFYGTLKLAALHARAQEGMMQAMMTCATMEISMAMVLVMELFTPARSVARFVAYANYLRMRYACDDDTVFRIKYTYMNSGFYHREFWKKIGEGAGPIVDRLGPVKGVVDAVKRWFTAGLKNKSGAKTA